MTNFTYEQNERKTKLETYEWDNVWIEYAPETNLKKILYIGDSISCGTRRIATLSTDEKLLFDGFGTSKAIDNPFFADSLKIFAAQQGYRNAVLFNNGLHGWHLDDTTGYAAHYEEMIEFLTTHFSGTPVYVVLTTHVADAARDKRVVARNKAASEIAQKYSLDIIDLYSLTLENASLLSKDGVHFVEDGYKLIAEKIINTLSEKISF